MGGGKEKKKTNAMIQEQYSQEKTAYNKGAGRTDADLQKYGGRGDAVYGDLENKYRSMAGLPTSGGTSATASAGSSGGGGKSGGGGGGGGGKFKKVEDFYKKLTGGTGGWDPTRLTSVQGDTDKMRAMYNDPEIANRMRGAGVYDEFAKTGGYSDTDKANIRARATSVIPSMFGRMKDEANRMSSVQGGYGPGRAALMSRMGRAQAGAMSDASLNAELGIADSVRSGRMGAATAMTGAEGGLQSLRGDAIGQSFDMTKGLETDIYGRQTAGFGGLERRAESDRAAAAAAAARSAANDRWNLSTGLSGLESLYGASEGGYGRGLDYDISNRSVNAQAQGNNLQMRGEANKGINWGKVAGAVGTGAMYAGMASARYMKENIEELDVQKMRENLKKLPIYLWSYKGDEIRHLGPMAEEFHELFGVGDGETLNLVDVIGVLLAVNKAQLLTEKESHV